MPRVNNAIYIICFLLIFLISPTSAQINVDAAVSQALSNPDIQKKFSTLSYKEQSKLLETYKNTQINDVREDVENEDNTNENTNEVIVSKKEIKKGSSIEEILNDSSLKNNSNLQPYFFEEIPSVSYQTEIEPESTQILQFGYDVFNKEISNIIDMNIPVNGDYVLGVGDSLIIRIWGKIEQEFEVEIASNGTIYMPKIGHIELVGVTYKNAKKIIKKSLDKEYVNYDLSVSMGQLKTIKVFILGDVKNPGAYDVSSLSTLFTTLHAAGGPTKKGTLRHIQLKRNGKTFTTVDLYDYLLKGNNENDPVLKNYDTIFIPPIGNVIKVSGSVKRPAIYELKYTTSVYTAIHQLAGGLWGTSNDANIKLKRVSNSHNHVLVDINTTEETKLDTLKKTYVKNNDQIFVSSILSLQNNTVKIDGMVFRSGVYAWTDGMTLKNLLDRASNLKPGASLKTIKLFRYVTDTKRELIVVDLTKTSSEQIELKEWDSVQVDPEKPEYVSISGGVEQPGTYQLFEKMTVSDLCVLADIKDDIVEFIELTSLNNKTQQYESKKIKLETILSDYSHPDNTLLKKNDIIIAQENKELTKIKTISVEGYVTYPGVYSIHQNETVKSIIERAGGLLDNASTNGVKLYRKGVFQNQQKGYSLYIENEQKRLMFQADDMRAGSSIEQLDILNEQAKGRLVVKNFSILEQTILKDNDKLVIPEQIESIVVVGGVQNSSGFMFIPNKNLSYYIELAGGRTEYTKRKDVYVFKVNGAIEKNPKKVERGDIIYLPEYVRENKNIWSKFVESVNTTVSLTASILTTVYLITNL